MKPILKVMLPLMGALLLQSCVLLAVYGVYRTVRDINDILTLVNTSLNRISLVIDEGKQLKRAADDGRLISSLARKIPDLVQKEVERSVNEKINELSGDLDLSAQDFTKNAIEEDLGGAVKSYNDMAMTFNSFADLITEMSDSVHRGGSAE